MHAKSACEQRGHPLMPDFQMRRQHVSYMRRPPAPAADWASHDRWQRLSGRPKHGVTGTIRGKGVVTASFHVLRALETLHVAKHASQRKTTSNIVNALLLRFLTSALQPMFRITRRHAVIGGIAKLQLATIPNIQKTRQQLHCFPHQCTPTAWCNSIAHVLQPVKWRLPPRN